MLNWTVKCSSPLCLYNIIAECTNKLSDSDLKDVQNYVWDARSKWFNIGCQLSIKIGDLEAIKKDNHDCGECFTQVLLTWLRKRNPAPTWQSLISALKVPAVGVQIHLRQ